MSGRWSWGVARRRAAMTGLGLGLVGAPGCVIDPVTSLRYERVSLGSVADAEDIELRLLWRGWQHGKEKLDEVHLRVGDKEWFVAIAFMGHPMECGGEEGKYRVGQKIGSGAVEATCVEPEVLKWRGPFSPGERFDGYPPMDKGESQDEEP